tara:strand:- start:1616 stop:2026 length:411 start_codon:yes stop_codon:yes gene_type:complete
VTDLNGLSECYDAFDRLKAGCPKNIKFLGISPDKITASIVSQEAGFDSGYLKKRRLNHQALIAQIGEFKREQSRFTLSRVEVQRREREKAKRYKDERDRLQQLLELSLARELLLAVKLKELESQLYRLVDFSKSNK